MQAQVAAGTQMEVTAGIQTHTGSRVCYLQSGLLRLLLAAI